MNAFQSYYLKGDTRAATLEFDRAVAELRSTGRGDLVARAELLRCATRAASLEFDDCPGFEKLRADAGPEELAYAEYLAGRGQRAASDDAMSRLVFLGVQFNSGKANPENISAAIDIASAQGWRRPLLAWLSVEEKRAAAAGDGRRAEATRRRIELILKPAGSQAFQPNRPVEFVVHSAPGGGSDVFARAVVEMAEKERLLPQPLRVVNKTAGAGMQAMAYLVEKRSDDHVIAVFTNTWIATPLASAEARFAIQDFTPVARLVLEPTIAVVRADSAFRSMNDFVQAAKNRPGSLKQAGGSRTAIESLTGLLVQSATGARWTFISTPSIKDRIANLLSGSVDIIIPQPQDVNEHIAGGRMRPIAAFTEKRIAVLPSVPTIREQGIGVPIIANARGILLPPQAEPRVVAYWEEFFARLTRTPSWKKYLEENQVEDAFLNSRELGPFLEEQTTLMRKLLQQAGVAVVR